jgi:hypothetical protein
MRACKAAEEKAKEDIHLWSFLVEGCDLPAEVLADVATTISKIDQIAEKLDVVEMMTRRIRSIADEDQPSQ